MRGLGICRRRYHTKDDPGAVAAEDVHRVERMETVGVEPDRSSDCGQLTRCRRPAVGVVDDTLDTAHPDRQYSQ